MNSEAKAGRRVFSMPDWADVVAGSADIDCKWSESLSRHTSFRVGGPVSCMARPRTEAAFASLVRLAMRERIPYVLLGGGSNVLAPDDAWDVLVVQPHLACGEIRRFGGRGTCLYVGAGVKLATWLSFCLRRGLGGAECLAGIPGTVGGALFMNAGTPDGCIADILVWVDVLDARGRRCRMDMSQLAPGYRTMGLSDDWVILGGCFQMRPASVEFLRAQMRETMLRRKHVQPLGAPSAGSVFKNPPGEYAGALIDRLDLKGFRIGDAGVSEKHANWIVNLGHARARDILAVMGHIEKQVWEGFGIRLEREIRVLGSESEREPLSTHAQELQARV